ncbi:16S rRNA (cytidine(1402)-2'-O)-methyltransferase [Candidatus Woesearchaeota archaeon]|nr:16S rRNA (cytidine(1402)-2'-O)-methyltransferase [Candidatus Woesearchaeota archaeon]
MLYLVATPIGNLEDITLRALRILKEADLILAEDTRRTSLLLKRYNLNNKLVSYNDINKTKKTKHIINLLKNNKNIALVSDSGTPGISDPGFFLVREGVKEKVELSVLPGANAAIAALVGSGLPTDKFSFYGFLPKKPNKKKEFFNEIKNKKETTIIYESPHRINKTIELLCEIMPDKPIVIARELTKKFEEFIRGTAVEINEKIKNRKIKGELVILLGKEL